MLAWLPEMTPQLVADAFYNGELEAELRRVGMIDYRFKVDADKGKMYGCFRRAEKSNSLSTLCELWRLQEARCSELPISINCCGLVPVTQFSHKKKLLTNPLFENWSIPELLITDGLIPS